MQIFKTKETVNLKDNITTTLASTKTTGNDQKRSLEILETLGIVNQDSAFTQEKGCCPPTFFSSAPQICITLRATQRIIFDLVYGVCASALYSPLARLCSLVESTESKMMKDSMCSDFALG